MVDGIGIDVVDIARFEASLLRTPALRQKLFTPRERTKSPASLAARFAAKEALYKALSPTQGLSWQDVEVINEESGQPVFLFYGDIATLTKGARAHLSLSHDGGVATAMVVLER
jgi:holo-[acyl-carrier protein] synthase